MCVFCLLLTFPSCPSCPCPRTRSPPSSCRCAFLRPQLLVPELRGSPWKSWHVCCIRHILKAVVVWDGISFVWGNLLATIFQLLRWELTQGWAPPAGIWSPGNFVSLRPKLFSLTSRMCRIPRSGVQSFFSVFTQISPVGPTWWKLHKSSKFWSNLHLDGKSWWGRILLEARLGSLLREQVWFWTGHLEQCYTSLGVFGHLNFGVCAMCVICKLDSVFSSPWYGVPGGPSITAWMSVKSSSFTCSNQDQVEYMEMKKGLLWSDWWKVSNLNADPFHLFLHQAVHLNIPIRSNIKSFSKLAKRGPF